MKVGCVPTDSLWTQHAPKFKSQFFLKRKMFTEDLRT